MCITDIYGIHSRAGTGLSLLEVSLPLCRVINRWLNPVPTVISEFTKAEKKWLNPSQQGHHYPSLSHLQAGGPHRHSRAKVKGLKGRPGTTVSFFSHKGEAVNKLSHRPEHSLIHCYRVGNDSVIGIGRAITPHSQFKYFPFFFFHVDLCVCFKFSMYEEIHVFHM